MNTTTCVIDGFGPVPIVRPTSVLELGALIRQAGSDGFALYPFGGQTKITLGMPPTKAGRAIDLGELAQIIDFPARDMTVTVHAGITIKALQSTLLKENLRLPIDVARSGQATLGGCLAANVSGPRRHGYGTLRDYVIGISALNDEGSEFKAGGRVVKNVAGYDLCKLLVGSLGTLGIITQATLKLRPLAEEQALIRLGCESAHLETLLTQLHDTRTRPVCVDLLNRVSAQAVFAQANLPFHDADWTLLVGYEGNADAVNWQVQQLVKEVDSRDQLDARIGFTAEPLWNALVEWSSGTFAGTSFKANLLPSAVASFCLAAEREPIAPALRAHAGVGIVYGSWTGDLTKTQAASMLTSWRDRAQQGQGSVIVTQCPADWKSTLSIWGPPSNDAWLMREIKAKFDPHRIFNPGRFLDGI